METWKPVLDFDGLYEVSDRGNVRRVARGKLLTAAQVTQAKEMLAQGETLKSVAVFLSTSITTIMAIKHGKTWNGDASYRPVKSAKLKHYLIASLCKDGKYIRRGVHRLVWEAFNGPIAGRLEVNHINLDRADNRLENLELLTHQQNIQHAHNIYKQERAHLPKGARSGPYGRYDNVKHD